MSKICQRAYPGRIWTRTSKEAIKRFILSQEAVNADETKLQVLDERNEPMSLNHIVGYVYNARSRQPISITFSPSDAFKEMAGDYSGTQWRPLVIEQSTKL